MAKIIVGLSGGVDSSVAAHLLVEQGHEVIALFMRNWYDDSVILNDKCPWIEDSNDAMLVADKLEIPFQVIDLSAEYKERVVDHMFAEYAVGRTPNPDILCNREIKFDVFLRVALNLGADYIATGHYCRKDSIKVEGKTIYRLLSGKDQNKDQSYFLSQLDQRQLSKVLFPIGHMEKPEVRRLATQLKLTTADKKDSQGLCFVGKVRLATFLQQKLPPKRGKVIEVPNESKVLVSNVVEELLELKEITAPHLFSPDMGKVIGEHNGAHYFTIGQRKGLAIGGATKPRFVLASDIRHNILYVGQGEDHYGLYKKGLVIKEADIHWVRKDLEMKIWENCSYALRIRYRQKLNKAVLYREPSGLYVIFNQSQKAITPGQFVSWYRDGEVIGSGIIDH